MWFNTIKKETENLITLTNYMDNIIINLGSILTGLFGLWLFLIVIPFFNDFSFGFHSFNSFYNVVMGVVVISLPVLFILQGFNNLMIKSKAKIDLKLQQIIIERKSSIKSLNSVEEINIFDLKKFKIIEVDDPETFYSWYINFVTNTGKLKFNLYSDKSELNELSDKMNKLIIHK